MSASVAGWLHWTTTLVCMETSTNVTWTEVTCGSLVRAGNMCAASENKVFLNCMRICRGSWMEGMLKSVSSLCMRRPPSHSDCKGDASWPTAQRASLMSLPQEAGCGNPLQSATSAGCMWRYLTGCPGLLGKGMTCAKIPLARVASLKGADLQLQGQLVAWFPQLCKLVGILASVRSWRRLRSPSLAKISRSWSVRTSWSSSVCGQVFT